MLLNTKDQQQCPAAADAVVLLWKETRLAQPMSLSHVALGGLPIEMSSATVLPSKGWGESRRVHLDNCALGIPDYHTQYVPFDPDRNLKDPVA